MIKSFLIQLCGAVFFAVACEMIMPEGSMKKYIRLAIGFVMISVIITPFNNEVDMSNFELEFSQGYSKEELEAKSDAYVLEAHKKNIEARVKEICAADADVYVDVFSDGKIKSITVRSDTDLSQKRDELIKETGCENVIITGRNEYEY